MPRKPAQWLPATCRRCGKEFLYNPTCTYGAFCSHACRFNQAVRVCAHCGKEFTIRASKADRYTHCSMECKRAAGSRTAVCEQCGVTFAIRKDRVDVARYCSYKCHNAAGRTTIICHRCGAERSIKRHRVGKNGPNFCGNSCATLYRLENEPPASGYIGKKIREQRRTDIEAQVEQVLIALGIPYLFEHKIGRYLIDFALPERRIALECDGWRHTTEQGKQRDAIRDAYLAEKGWRVIHLEDRAIRRDAHNLVAQALTVDLP
jgi:very-short-patch-repair endonuclease